MLELPTQVPDVLVFHLACHTFFDQRFHPRHRHVLPGSQVVFRSPKLHCWGVKGRADIFSW